MQFIRGWRLPARSVALWAALWATFAMSAAVPAFAAEKCDLDYVLKEHLLSTGFTDISERFYSAPDNREWSRDKGWIASYALDPGYQGFSVFVGWRALARDMSGLTEAEAVKAMNISTFARKASGQGTRFVMSSRLGGDPLMIRKTFLSGPMGGLYAPDKAMHDEIAILAGPRCVFQAAVIGPTETAKYPNLERPIRDGIHAKIIAAGKLILAREGAVTLAPDPVAAPPSQPVENTADVADKPEKLPVSLQLGVVVIAFGLFFLLFWRKVELEKDAGIYCLIAAAMYLVSTLAIAWLFDLGADDVSVQVIVLSISVLSLSLHALAVFVVWSDLVVKAGAALVFAHATFMLIARFYARLDSPFLDYPFLMPLAFLIFFFLHTGISIKYADSVEDTAAK